MDSAAPIPPGLAMRMLFVRTLAFAVCFAAWTMLGVTGVSIRGQLGFDSNQFAAPTATPVFTEALL